MKKQMNSNNITDVSFILPTKNTLNYTLMAYRSLRQYYPDNEIIMLDDGSNDGTEDWLFGCLNENGVKLQGQIDLDDNLRAWRNTTGNILGHTITYDIGIKMAKNKLVTIFHSDMIAGNNYLENLVKHWVPKRVVCATRIEPEGIYPPGKEKILKPFGIEFHEFKREEFEKFVEEEQRVSKGQITKGIFAPWLIAKDDFLAIGGHDAKSFAPYPHEDQDIFMRWKLAGYELIQSRDSLTYHFISRGHRSWANNGVGKDDNMFQFYSNRASRNYLRKWRKWMSNDEFRMPITHPVYNIGLIIQKADNLDLLHFVEPWFSCVYVSNENLVKEYIAREQPTTKIDLTKRVKSIDRHGEDIIHDILMEFDQDAFLKDTNQNSGVISMLTDILVSSNIEDDAEFDFGIFIIRTKKIKDLAPTLIKV